jgi:hypothetical protein
VQILKATRTHGSARQDYIGVIPDHTGLQVILNLLVQGGFLRKSGQGAYLLTRRAKRFLTNQDYPNKRQLNAISGIQP